MMAKRLVRRGVAGCARRAEGVSSAGLRSRHGASAGRGGPRRKRGGRNGPGPQTTRCRAKEGEPLQTSCKESEGQGSRGLGMESMSIGTRTSMDELCRSMEVIDTHEGRLPPLNELFQALRLQSLNEKEIRKVFESVDEKGKGHLCYEEVEELVRQRLADPSSDSATIRRHVHGIMDTFDMNRDGEVTYDEFASKIRDLSQAIDRRVIPLAILVGLVGLAAGMVQPLMPLLVKDVGISLSQYGMISSVYGLVKTLANVPAAILQDSLGRLPVMLGALAAMGCGFTGIGLSKGALSLLLSRASVGAGISTWNIATTSYSLDVSHALNRARSMAPALTAFSIGGIAGPFLGGCIVEQVGLRAAYFVVAFIFGVSAIVLRLTLEETRAQATTGERVQRNKKPPVETLKAIISDPEMHATIAVNGANRLIMGTAKCTLLPLLLVNHLGMGTAQVGMVFSAMSAFALLTAQSAATFSDTVGHRRALVPAAACQGLAVLVLPLCDIHMAFTAAALTAWAVSHSLINSSMYPHVSALAGGAQTHSQSLATLKFTGDTATIFGGLLGGVLAHRTSVGTAIAVLGALQTISALWLLMEAAFRERGDEAPPLAPSATS